MEGTIAKKKTLTIFGVQLFLKSLETEWYVKDPETHIFSREMAGTFSIWVLKQHHRVFGALSPVTWPYIETFRNCNCPVRRSWIPAFGNACQSCHNSDEQCGQLSVMVSWRLSRIVKQDALTRVYSEDKRVLQSRS